MNNQSQTKRSTWSWLAELAERRKGEYLLSVLVALSGVACSLMPYLVMIELIHTLVGGTADKAWCLNRCAVMGLWWVLRYALHSVSTTLSHHATFHVLADIRIRLMNKLATLPLGTVLEKSSGSYKNIIVERVDSIETTLAHLVPEMTSNVVGALAVLALLFRVDWRMGLATLIVLPLGIACFMLMLNGYEAKFQRAVNATKALNDTAVEYINGIEVIKAFGRPRPATRNLSRRPGRARTASLSGCAVVCLGKAPGWRSSLRTLIGILPVGCLLFMHGTLTVETFLMVIILSFGIMQPLITRFLYG